MKTLFIVITGGYLLPIFSSVEDRISIEESLIKAEMEEDPGMYNDGEFIRVSNEYIGETLTVISNDIGETIAVFDKTGDEVDFEKNKPLSSRKWREFRHQDPFLPEPLREKGMNTHKGIYLRNLHVGRK